MRKIHTIKQALTYISLLACQNPVFRSPCDLLIKWNNKLCCIFHLSNVPFLFRFFLFFILISEIVFVDMIKHSYLSLSVRWIQKKIRSFSISLVNLPVESAERLLYFREKWLRWGGPHWSIPSKLDRANFLFRFFLWLHKSIHGNIPCVHFNSFHRQQNRNDRCFSALLTYRSVRSF